MLETTEKYKQEITKVGRTFTPKIVINNKEYVDIKELTISEGVEEGDAISFGSTYSKKVTFKLPYENTVFNGQKAIVYIDLNVDGQLEILRKATLYIAKVKRIDEYLQFECYDNFYVCEKLFTSDLKGQQPIKEIVKEQCLKLGFSFQDDIENVKYDVGLLQGLSIREAFSYLASYLGKNAVFDEMGNIKFVFYKPTGVILDIDDYAAPLEINETDVVINSLTCITKVEETEVDEDGETSVETVDKEITVGEGYGITFSCLGMTKERLNVLYERVKGFKWRIGNIDLLHSRPDLEPGDIVQIIDKDENTYTVPIMEVESYCDGGFQSKVDSKGRGEEEDKYEFKGALGKQVERAYSEVIAAKEIMANTITAFTGKFEKIDTDILNVNVKLTALEAQIGDLDVDSLTARIAVIEEAYISRLEATELFAAKADIGILSAEVANINTLLTGSAVSGSIQTIVLNAENTTIQNALIKDAMIDNLSFNKITGVDINTTKFTVHSEDGKSTWKDNTIQIQDNERVRVQIGKDASEDYNMYLWDVEGNLMFDALGVTEDGIQRPIIVDDMVNDDAHINGSKLDIESVIVEINDGSTTINSSKIYFDDKEQTLDILFNSMTDQVESNTTAITIANGNISVLLSQMTNVETSLEKINGNITQLTNSYNSLTIDLGGIKGQIGNLESTVVSVEGQILGINTSLTEVKDNQASYEATLVNFGGRLSSTETNIVSIESNLLDIDIEVKSIKTQQASFEVDLSSITGKVSVIENDVESINGDITSLGTRVQNAEFKLEPTNIVLAVNEELSESGKIYTTKFVLDKTGAHFSGGGIDISNNSGKKVFYADASGNLSLEGNINATSGKIGGFSISNERLQSQFTKYYSYTTADVNRIMNIVMGSITPTSSDYAKYDFDGNGRISAVDYVMVQNTISRGNKNDINFYIDPLAKSSNVTDGIFNFLTQSGKFKILPSGAFYADKGTVINFYSDYIGTEMLSTTQDGIRLSKLGPSNSLKGEWSTLIYESTSNNTIIGARDNPGATHIYAGGYIRLYTQGGGGAGNALEAFRESSGSYRTVFRASVNNGAYLGTSSYRWNTVFCTTLNQSSDRKIKTDIQDINLAKEFVMNVKAQSYKMIKDEYSSGERTQMGFIAQDVNEVVKDLGMGDMAITSAVIVDGENEYPYHGEEIDDSKLMWSLKYDQFIPPLYVVAQSHEDEIQSLKKRVAYLESTLSRDVA